MSFLYSSLSLKNSWTRILNAGTLLASNNEEVKKIRVLNAVAFFGMISQFYYVGVMYHMQQPFWVCLGNISCFLFCGLIIRLNALGKFQRAVLVFFSILPLNVLAFTLIFGNIGTENVHFFLICLSFFFFRLRSVFWVSAYIFLCLVIAKWSIDNIDYSAFAWAESFYFYPGIFLSSFLISLTVLLFKQENELYQQQIEAKNAALLNKNEEISQQREELISQSEVLHEQKLNLERAYDHITDSVKYARNIQLSLLPPLELIERSLPEAFVFYKPKDIVSGDFYWFSEQEEYLFLAIVDCTGHGVPGAFMTVIGNNLLNQIIREQKIISPAKILQELDFRLIQTLQQQNGAGVEDGMDIALCRIDKAKSEVLFAGAKRPLFYMAGGAEGNGGLQEIKGSRVPIGSSQYKEKLFEEVLVKGRRGDAFYIFTDGYADQFGGLQLKKFMIGPFRRLIEGIHQQEMEQQQRILGETFESWQAGQKQTDDVLVMGFRL